MRSQFPHLSALVESHLETCRYCLQRHRVEIRRDRQGTWVRDMHSPICARRPGTALSGLVDAEVFGESGVA